MPICTSAPRLCSLFLAVLLLGLGTLSAPPARAQEASEEESIPFEGGAWALQFGVGRNFTLTSFTGSLISAKKHTSAARAWQFGVGANTLVTFRRGEGGSRGQEGLEVTTRYLAYPLLGDQDLETVQLFLGAGPLVSFDRNRIERPDEGEDRTTWRWGVGASGTIGAEWFVHPRISLSGTYETSLRFRQNRMVFEDRETQTENVFQLGSGRARLGVSVYF